ncbi:unnamed protein product [Phytomonas sp. EM1]|nr:unnamed protein product [Phytomonas sp. EM1]|eukprot:CCW65465.1 unnamed protein product [Phytomonas sp. isolate EM1]
MPPKQPKSNLLEDNEGIVSSSKAILRFGAQIYEEYSRTPLATRRDGLQLSRFGDYLHHFGFSLELEAATREGYATPMPNTKVPKVHAKETLDREGLPSIDTAEIDTYSSHMASEMRDKLPTMDLGALAVSVSAPYDGASWRQTKEGCELMKVRCLYQWLCGYFEICLHELVDPQGAGEKRDEDSTKPTESFPGARTKAATGRPNVNLRATMLKNKNQKAVVVEEPAPPPDPIETALRTHVATPRTVAVIYQRMLQAVNVPCEVVEGWLKGYAPGEAFEWTWNRVQVYGRDYLVDIAGSIYRGPLRCTGQPVNPLGLLSKGQGSLGAATSHKTAGPLNLGKRQPEKRDVSVGSTSTTRSISQVELPNVSLGKMPRFLTTQQVVDSYFFVCPEHFIHTHFPRDPRDSLLKQPPPRVAWDVSPRLAESYFRHSGLSLRSHCRTSLLSFCTSPFYITFLNETPSTTELCCVLYPGTLKELPEDLNGAQPLGPQWVWNQRQESTCEETFTLMVPQSGFYCVVIGARLIRADPYNSTVVSAEEFIPLVRYQVKVKFIPSSIPLLPRQHLSPVICRLISPLSQQLQEGKHKFAVMPSCSNISAVAVVVCRPGNRETADSDTRRVQQFLRFLPERAAYEGEVMLHAGHLVEVWVLYGGPDRNGQTFEERVKLARPAADGHSSSAQNPQAAVPRMKRPASFKKKPLKRDVAAAEASVMIEETRSLARRLAEAQVFIPMITNIEVRLLLSKDVDTMIQPQPSIEVERAATWRRLMGNTSELHRESVDQQQRLPRIGCVGTYFNGRATSV